MKTFTFSVEAHLSIDARTEQEARDRLYRSLYEQDVDMPYGDGMVYISSNEMPTAEIVDVYEQQVAA